MQISSITKHGASTDTYATSPIQVLDADNASTIDWGSYYTHPVCGLRRQRSNDRALSRLAHDASLLRRQTSRPCSDDRIYTRRKSDHAGRKRSAQSHRLNSPPPIALPFPDLRRHTASLCCKQNFLGKSLIKMQCSFPCETVKLGEANHLYIFSMLVASP